jgi:hypothetical protein
VVGADGFGVLAVLSTEKMPANRLTIGFTFVAGVDGLVCAPDTFGVLDECTAAIVTCWVADDVLAAEANAVDVTGCGVGLFADDEAAELPGLAGRENAAELVVEK